MSLCCASKKFRLAQEFGVRRIGLFGSFARGQATEASDIDLVVEFDGPIGLRFVDLVEDLERVFGRKVDLLTPAGVHSIRRREVAKAIAEDILYVQ
ncbi:nucleotidyltransferase family protein [uncultured Thiodictyon sp.]|uniref:nucleotidyltransferase family protein n=1 Tax=uncultured Thiodictyon sp. TaxID=1846217 RepID=UPI0025DA662E|nr:nucleotidyltransferase family protein [uncultured Thiodictyon sp.]